jgi:hypothetical protein
VLTGLCDGLTFGEIRENFAEHDILAVNAAIERVCGALLAIGVLYLECAHTRSR